MPEEILKDLPDVFIKGILQGIWITLKAGWLPLTCIVIMVVVVRILNNKIDRRNYLRRKEREEQEWEDHMEKFLDMKDQHDRKKTDTRKML